MNILDYIRGDRRGPQANRLERQAMSDPLLADALEGYDAVEGHHPEVVDRLRDRIAVRARGRRSHRWAWTVAAAGVALLLSGGGLYRFVLRPAGPVLPEMADFRAVVEEEMIPALPDTTLRIAQARDADETLREPPPEIESETSAPELERQRVQVVADAINVVSDDRNIESTISFEDLDEEAEFVFQPATSTVAEESAAEEAPVIVEMLRSKAQSRAATPSQFVDSAADRKIETSLSFSAFDNDTEFVFRPAASGGVTEAVEEDAPFVKVEKMPSFQGGDLNTFRNWVRERLVYPPIAQENGVQGRVTVQFVIERDGTLTNIVVINSPDRSLAEEAVRIIKTSPKWRPGSDRGIPARVSFTLPVDFQLQ